MHQITKIRVFKMWETCDRTTFFVELTTDEGFTMTPASYATGSSYNDWKGLSVDDARTRALYDADIWSDFLGIPVEPFVDCDQTWTVASHQPYNTRRILAARVKG